jgi:hypothetical protein
MDGFNGNLGIITSAAYKGKAWLFLGELGEHSNMMTNKWLQFNGRYENEHGEQRIRK